MEIKHLADSSFDELFMAFQRAFADYEIQLNKSELSTMLKRRGFDAKLSFAAFENGEIVSFTCNGIGNFNGTPTAYDSGTGTLKEYRGEGVATRVFEYSIPYLREASIQEYLLEVLQHNTGAVSVYRKLNFNVVREFHYFRSENRSIHVNTKTLDFPYTMQAVNINDHTCLTDFWDFKPSWQNSFESINRSLADFICTGVFSEGKLIGYGVFDPFSGDVTQLAVAKHYRRKGVGSLLFQKMLDSNKLDSVKIVNTDVHCHSIQAFLKSQNLEPTGKQYEMIRKI